MFGLQSAHLRSMLSLRAECRILTNRTPVTSSKGHLGQMSSAPKSSEVKQLKQFPRVQFMVRTISRMVNAATASRDLRGFFLSCFMKQKSRDNAAFALHESSYSDDQDKDAQCPHLRLVIFFSSWAFCSSSSPRLACGRTARGCSCKPRPLGRIQKVDPLKVP